MATVTESVIDAYLACPDARCPGHRQQPAQARKVTTSFSFADNGGDWPGEERSTHHITFLDGVQPDCPHCGRPMDISDQQRPVYARVSGQDPMRIYDLDQVAQVHDVQLAQAKRDLEMAEMKAMIAQQSATISELKGERPRGPGRPRKDDAA